MTAKTLQYKYRANYITFLLIMMNSNFQLAPALLSSATVLFQDSHEKKLDDTILVWPLFFLNFLQPKKALELRAGC